MIDFHCVCQQSRYIELDYNIIKLLRNINQKLFLCNALDQNCNLIYWNLDEIVIDEENLQILNHHIVPNTCIFKIFFQDHFFEQDENSKKK